MRKYSAENPEELREVIDWVNWQMALHVNSEQAYTAVMVLKDAAERWLRYIEQKEDE